MHQASGPGYVATATVSVFQGHQAKAAGSPYNATRSGVINSTSSSWYVKLCLSCPLHAAKIICSCQHINQACKYDHPYACSHIYIHDCACVAMFILQQLSTMHVVWQLVLASWQGAMHGWLQLSMPACFQGRVCFGWLWRLAVKVGCEGLSSEGKCSAYPGSTLDQCFQDCWLKWQCHWHSNHDDSWCHHWTNS